MYNSFGMRINAMPWSFFLMLLLPYLSISQQGVNPTLKSRTGLSFSYYLPSPREDMFLSVPPEPDFMQLIYSDHEIYNGISSQIQGEILGVEPYGSDHIVNWPSIGLHGAIPLSKTISASAGVSWQRGNHTRSFEISYFNPEMEIKDVLPGEFSASRDIIDITAGLQYTSPTNFRFLLEAGPLLSGVYYQDVIATTGDFTFQVSPSSCSWHGGLFLSAGAVIFQSDHWRMDALLSAQAIFAGGESIFTPGAGIIFSYLFSPKKRGGQVSDEQHQLDSPLPGPYYPEHILPIMAAEDQTNDTIIQPYIPQSYYQLISDTTKMLAGANVCLEFRDLAADWVIYPPAWSWINRGYWTEETATANFAWANENLCVGIPEHFAPGVYILSFTIESDQIQEEIHVVIPVQVTDSEVLVNDLTGEQLTGFYSSQDILREIWKKRDRLIRHRDSLRVAADSARDVRESAADNAQRLAKIDVYLDKLPGVVGPQVNDLLDSLKRIANAEPQILDTNALNDLIYGLQQAIRDCLLRTEGLKEKQKTLAKEISEMKKAQEELMKKIHKLFLDNGFTGRYGLSEDGRYHLGYMGDRNSNTDYGNLPWEKEVDQLKKELKKMNKEYREKLREQEELPDLIGENEKKCEELQQQLEEAKRLKEQANELEAVKAQVIRECEYVKDLVKKLLKWCEANPGICSFSKDIREFLEKDCPQTPEQWEDFWKDYNDLLQIKKKKEKELEDLVKEQDKELEEIDDAIKDDTDKIDSTWSDEVKVRNEEIRLAEEAKRQKQLDEQAHKNEEARIKKELTDCWEKMAKWLKDNEDKLDPDDTGALSDILQTLAESAGEGAKDVADGMAKGASTGEIGMSGASSAIFNLIASLTYLYMQYRVVGVANKVMDRVIKDKIAPLIHLDKNRCGIITLNDGTTYFYIKTGDKTLLFKISDDDGLSFEGEI